MGDGDGIDVFQLQRGFFEGFADDGEHVFDVGAAGDFGDDAAIAPQVKLNCVATTLLRARLLRTTEAAVSSQVDSIPRIVIGSRAQTLAASGRLMNLALWVLWLGQQFWLSARRLARSWC